MLELIEEYYLVQLKMQERYLKYYFHGRQQQYCGDLDDKVGMLKRNHGTRCDPVQHECAQQHGGRWTARDP